MRHPLFAVMDATWPAASARHIGGFLVREGLGGGSRVSSASLEGPLERADISAAIAAQRALGQEPKFLLRPGEDALDTALAERGFEMFDPVTFYQARLDTLPCEPAPVTAFAHWPPLAIAREVWAEGGIGPARQAVADRANVPKAVILGRMNDRAAGTAFVAIEAGVAMLHGLSILPEFRRHGLARAMMAEAARWARATGAGHMALAVTQANAPANALYRALGMAPVCSYHYRREARA